MMHSDVALASDRWSEISLDSASDNKRCSETNMPASTNVPKKEGMVVHFVDWPGTCEIPMSATFAPNALRALVSSRRVRGVCQLLTNAEIADGTTTCRPVKVQNNTSLPGVTCTRSSLVHLNLVFGSRLAAFT